MSQQGFSIVEVTIASALGLLVVLMATELLGVVAQSHRLQSAQADLDDNARVAARLLRRELRMAGYPGCHPGIRRNLLPAGGQPEVPALRATADSGQAPGTDALAIRRFRSLGMGTIVAGPATGPRISLEQPHSVPSGGMVMVVADSGARCVLFRHAGADVRALDRGPGPDTAPRNRVPSSGYLELKGRVEILVPERVVLAVGRAPQAGESGGLYRRRRSAGDRREWLVPGIDGLAARYGRDTDGDQRVDAYMPAIGIDDWRAVRAVSLQLTATHAASPRALAGAMSREDGGPAGDGRLYRALDIRVALRNPTP